MQFFTGTWYNSYVGYQGFPGNHYIVVLYDDARMQIFQIIIVINIFVYLAGKGESI
jgi:hypothetical protein